MSGKTPTVTSFKYNPLISKNTTLPGAWAFVSSIAAAICPLPILTNEFTPPPYRVTSMPPTNIGNWGFCMETISIESDSELVMNNCAVLESYAEISHAPSLPSVYLPNSVELYCE